MSNRAHELYTDIHTIKLLLEKHSLSINELQQILEKQELLVPVSIFKSKIGPLATLCVFLKDEKGLRFSEIAKLLSRDQRTIWATYAKARTTRLKLDYSLTVVRSSPR